MESNMSNLDQCLDQCHILQLNDDCFYEIYKFLPPIDWCSLSETCTRLRTISDYWFNRQSERFDLQPSIVYGAKKDAYLSLNDSKRLIRKFGRFMTTLSINRRLFIDTANLSTLLPLVDQHCLALKNLRLFGIDFIARRLVPYDRLFSNLHRLEFDDCRWFNKETFQFWMVRCTSLKELELRNSLMIGCNLDHRFKSLKAFVMISCYSLDPDSVRKFYSKNPQLKEIKMLCNVFGKSNNLLEDVVVTLPNLKSLSLIGNRNFHPNIIPATTSAFWELKLDLESIEDDTIIKRLFTDLAAHNSVKNVAFFHSLLGDTVIEHLCKLKAVQILKLTSVYDLNDNNCTKLAREWPAVSEIHLYDCIEFIKINEFVTHAANLKRIIVGQSFRLNPKLITVEMFLSLAEARKKKENQEILLVFLDASCIVYLLEEFERNRLSDILSNYSNVIQLLPLEEEHRKNYYNTEKYMIGSKPFSILK